MEDCTLRLFCGGPYTEGVQHSPSICGGVLCGIKNNSSSLHQCRKNAHAKNTSTVGMRSGTSSRSDDEGKLPASMTRAPISHVTLVFITRTYHLRWLTMFLPTFHRAYFQPDSANCQGNETVKHVARAPSFSYRSIVWRKQFGPLSFQRVCLKVSSVC